MASQAQIDANRRNAEKSTGPKTDAGKSVARLNAVKHGLTAARVVLEDEDADEFHSLRDELEREREPVGRQETDLVEIIAMGMWRRRRINRMEADILGRDRTKSDEEACTKVIYMLLILDDRDRGICRCRGPQPIR